MPGLLFKNCGYDAQFALVFHSYSSDEPQKIGALVFCPLAVTATSDVPSASEEVL
jgi:hypothetical protein